MSFDSRDLVSNGDIEKERQARQDRQNPPSVEHGQGSDDPFSSLNIDDLFGPSPSSPTDNNNSFNSFGDPNPMGGPNVGADPFLNPIGGIPTVGGMPPTPFGQNPNQPTQPKSDEEKIMEAGKKSWSFLKDLGSGFHDVLQSTATNWSMTGKNLVMTSSIICGISFLTMMVFKKDVMDYMLGSGFGAIAGVLVLAFNNDKARMLKGTDELPKEEPVFDINKIEEDTMPPQDDIFANAFEQPVGVVDLVKQPLEDELPSDENQFTWDEDEDDDEDDDGWDEYEEDDEEEEYEDEEMTEFVTVEDIPTDINTVLTEVDQVPAGMYTRLFLFENYQRALVNMTPSYSETIYLTEDDAEWDAYSSVIREVQLQMDLESGEDDYESDLSEILSVEKRLLTVYVEATRPKKMKNAKVEEFNKELSNIVSMVKGRKVEGRYSQTIAVGSRIYITIFTGETANVSVKDAITKERDFFLDQSNRIPVVMGFNELGDTIKADLYDIESILTAGMPRGGKSFSVKTVMSQMIQFCSPTQVNFYFGDVKGQLSDWYEFKMPHVKRFESDPQRILAMLTYLTDIEGPRRAKILSEAGAQNIKDYNSINPDAELPLIYVVIDEMATLMQKFTTDEQKTYKARLVDITTKMPGFGVRLWGIPHLIKNDMIPKSVSDLVPCRISVKGDESHIESTTGAKPSKFKFKLSHVGDCAVNMPVVSNEVFFMHSFILDKSGQGVSRVLDYQTKLWEKLDPDSTKSSWKTSLESNKKQKVMLDKMNLSSDPIFTKDGMY
ncbi:FtsK/SpoIIIE domain-containing protein [Bacillus cereus]|nr:FtsK/SpoIIIE domain-containing protein [Bacillus cereus]